jgi:hypothetical protein
MSHDNMPKENEKFPTMSIETKDKEHEVERPPKSSIVSSSRTIAQDHESNATSDDEDNDKEESTLNEKMTGSKREKRLARSRASARERRRRQKKLIASLEQNVLQLSRKVQGLQEYVARLESKLLQADKTIEILRAEALFHGFHVSASSHLIRELNEQHAVPRADVVNLLLSPQSRLLRAPIASSLRKELQESRLIEIMAQTREQNERVHDMLVHSRRLSARLSTFFYVGRVGHESPCWA